MKYEKNPAALHAGHRERVWARYQQAGLDAFAEHEILELILMQAIPRVDVNPTAHRLIDRFGSLAGVLDAPEAELREIPGVGEKAARYLHLLPAISRAYARFRGPDAAVLDTLDKAGAYLRSVFIGETEEKLYLLLLDNRMHLLGCSLLATGTVNQVNVNKRRIIELVIHSRAACVILAHNHPHGLAVASSQDRGVTAVIESLLGELGVCLVEHVIVTDHNYAPTMAAAHSDFYARPVNEHFDGEFFRRFYCPEPERTTGDDAAEGEGEDKTEEKT